jgi:hypothetical protein
MRSGVGEFKVSGNWAMGLREGNRFLRKLSLCSTKHDEHREFLVCDSLFSSVSQIDLDSWLSKSCMVVPLNGSRGYGCGVCFVDR